MMSNSDALNWFIDHRPAPLRKSASGAYARAETAIAKQIVMPPRFYDCKTGIHYCPNCGAPLGPYFKFCASCGQRIRK